MKLSAAFVTIAAAFTGSANAAETTNGNLRATSLAKAEVFEEPTDPVSSYEQCVLENCALKKPKDTDAQKLTEEELKIFFEQCVSDCRGPDDASRAAVDEAYSPECSVECADDAAGELKEVSKDCDSKKDIQCKKCNGLEEGEELDKCEEELDDCEECEKEVEEAQRSVQKASDKLEECLPKCIISEYQTSIEFIEEPEVFEEPSSAVAGFENCVLDVCKLKKPKDKDAQQITEGDLEHFFGECVNSCYGPDEASRAAVERAFPPECAEACAAEAGGELKEVSRSCSSKNDIKCKECDKDDEVDDPSKYKKCMKEYKECEKCQDEVDDAQKSVKKASQKLFKCLPMCNPDYQTYIEMA